MGYGLGVFLTALGLILALAVQDMIDAIDLTMIGWILVLAGVLVLVLTAVQTKRQASAHDHGDHDPPRRQPVPPSSAPPSGRTRRPPSERSTSTVRPRTSRSPNWVAGSLR